MAEKSVNELRAALKSVLDHGASDSAAARQARDDAWRVFIHSFPVEIERAYVVEACGLALSGRLANMPTTFADAVKAYGSSLLDEVVRDNPRMLETASKGVGQEAQERERQRGG